jgi:hypothetical protein
MGGDSKMSEEIEDIYSKQGVWEPLTAAKKTLEAAGRVVPLS